MSYLLFSEKNKIAMEYKKWFKKVQDKSKSPLYVNSPFLVLTYLQENDLLNLEKIKEIEFCKHNKDCICTNADCPYLADYCPVISNDKICIYNKSNSFEEIDLRKKGIYRKDQVEGFKNGRSD